MYYIEYDGAIYMLHIHQEFMNVRKEKALANLHYDLWMQKSSIIQDVDMRENWWVIFSYGSMIHEVATKFDNLQRFVSMCLQFTPERKIAIFKLIVSLMIKNLLPNEKIRTLKRIWYLVGIRIKWYIYRGVRIRSPSVGCPTSKY